MFRTTKDCFCAFCKEKRRIYAKKHIALVDVALSLLASGFVMFILWQDFHPAVVAVFGFFCGLAEIFVGIRWRLSISCPHCGFDPVLYKRNHNLAAEKVNAFLDRRKQDPASALMPMPKLPVLIKRKLTELKDKSSLPK